MKRFAGSLESSLLLNRVEQGAGRVVDTPDGTSLLALEGGGRAYANAQLDDYQNLPRAQFRWRPPVRLTIRARFGWQGHAFDGTGGFGFWNAPYGGAGRLPVLPVAIWFFFGGRSSNMAFARGVPGNGWKAASINAHVPVGYAMMPLAPVGLLLMRNPRLYAWLWPWVQRWLGIYEHGLDAAQATVWHTYEITWEEQSVEFRIDKNTIHTAPIRIQKSLGLIIWIDNQYLIATPQGRLRSGTAASVKNQWLEIADLRLE